MPGPHIDQIRLIDFTDGEPAIGMGFNSTTLMFPGTALTFSTAAAAPDDSPQIVTGEAVVVNSHEGLMDAIGTSVGVSGRYELASASVKVDYSKSTGYNSTSTFVLAKASVTNPIKRGVNFVLTDTARALLTANNINDFNAAFGDSFVRGLKTGGEFFAVFRLTALRETTQQSLGVAAAAEINGLAAAGSFHGQFTQAQIDEKDRAEVQVSFYQAAGSGPTASVTLDVQSILQRLKDFSTIARDSPMAYKAEIATYDTIPIPIPTPEEREDFLLSLRHDDAKKLDYIRRSNDINFAIQHPEFFDDLPTGDQLQAQAEIYIQLINAVMEHAVRLAKGQIDPPQEFDPAKVGLTEPVEIHFKRKANAPTDIGPFQGNWQNTNNQDNLLSITITPIDQIHADVRARYQGFPNEFESTAEWNNADKALFGRVDLRPGHTEVVGGIPIRIPEFGSLYEIAEMPNTAQTLVVTNAQGPGPVIIGGPDVVLQVSTFSRSGA